MLLSDKAYNTLKWVAQLLLPASGTFYYALAATWGLPYGEHIVGTIAALTTFLGVILGISTSQYKKTGADGQLLIDTSDPSKDIYRIDLGANFDQLGDKKTITLTVRPNQIL